MIGRKEEDSIGQGMMGEQDDGVCVGSVVVWNPACVILLCINVYYMCELIS
jgi:hypothetical protein